MQTEIKIDILEKSGDFMATATCAFIKTFWIGKGSTREQAIEDVKAQVKKDLPHDKLIFLMEV